MAKYYGAIGFSTNIETVPGVWEDQIVEKYYRGDVTLSQFRWQPKEQVNDNLNIDNAISILCDDFLYENFQNIKYITWHGFKWKIQSLSIQRPRLVIQIGGVYNE